jgi:hypothetical protein
MANPRSWSIRRCFAHRLLKSFDSGARELVHSSRMIGVDAWILGVRPCA